MDIRGRSTWNVLGQKASKHHTLNFHHYFTISEKRTQRLRHQIGGQQDQLREGDHQGNADEGGRNKRHQCGAPSQENTKLRLEFPDDVVKKLDGNDPGIKLNNEQYVKIQRYQDEMIELLGTDIWHRIERIPQIRSCKPSMLKIIAEKLKTDSNWPTNCDALQNNNTWEWRDALGDIIEILEYHRKGHLRYYACACSNGWKMTIKELYNTVKDYGITYEDIFTFERYVSFNLSSIIAVINIIRQELYPNSSNIANFVYKASNAFLPKIVFQLEEYGLPRMISKKIQNAGLINLEDDSKEITIVIQEFNTIGIEYLEQKIPNLHSFDKYILKHFMNGIRCITTNQKN